MKRAAVLAGLWLCLLATTAGAAVRCAVCRAALPRTHQTFRKAGRRISVCTRCARTAPRCALCRIPVSPKRARTVGGKGVCPECARLAKTCSACNALIRGSYRQYDDSGDIWCPRCFARAPQCAGCKRALKAGAGAIVRGERVCPACKKRLPACTLCRRTILGTATSHTYGEGLFCRECEEGRPHCTICDVPVPGAATARARPLCARCRATSVTKDARLDFIHRRVAAVLRNTLGMRIRSPYTIAFEDDPAALKPEGRPSAGKELGLCRGGTKGFVVTILRGIPEGMCYETVAHELAHVWYFERGGDREPILAEGFAEWTASKVLVHFGYTRELARLRARTDVYGQGYRRYAAEENKAGLKAVLRRIEK